MWFDGLTDAEKDNWTTFQGLFTAQFDTKQFKFQARVKAEGIKRQKTESIRQYALRIQQVVDIGWSGADAPILLEKKREIFCQGLFPQIVKGFAFEKLIETPGITWAVLIQTVDDKDISISLGSEKFAQTDDVRQLQQQIETLNS